MGDFIPVILHLTIALLYYSQVQAQGYVNTPVSQTSTFLIPKTFFDPTPTNELLSIEARITNSVGTTLYTWDCQDLTNFILGQYCQGSNNIPGYTFSVDARGTSTYPYTVGENVVPGYLGTSVICPPEPAACFPQFSGLERGDPDTNTIFIQAIMTSSAVFTGGKGSSATTSSSAAPTSSSAAPTVVSTATLSSAPSRPSSSNALASSTKIGVGIGVPFGVTIAAIVAFLCVRYIRHKKQSRLRHSGSIAAAGLYPASDQTVKLNAGQTELSPLGHEEDVTPSANIRELHGWDISPYSRELEGSPGPARKQLP